MKNPPIGVPKIPRRIVSRDGLGLFAFIRTLRLAVRAKVAADQSSGLALAEIVVHVREMVSRSEDAANHSGPRPSPAFRAIAKQAEAWCLEAYQPSRGRSDQPFDRFPSQSPA